MGNHAAVHLRRDKNATLVDSVDKLKEFLRRCDANGDGRLNRAEVRNAFEKLGVTGAGLQAIFAVQRADENGDGFISEHELDGLLKYCLEHGYMIELAPKQQNKF